MYPMAAKVEELEWVQRVMFNWIIPGRFVCAGVCSRGVVNLTSIGISAQGQWYIMCAIKLCV